MARRGGGGLLGVGGQLRGDTSSGEGFWEGVGEVSPSPVSLGRRGQSPGKAETWAS